MTLSYDISEETLLEYIKDYAYNGMEICRIINGFDPYDFKGCNYSTKEKPFFSPKGGCRFEKRGCQFRYSLIYYRLNKLEKEGKIKSLKMKWFDSRDTGAVDYIPLDLFRYYYIDQSLLATRLCQDVITKVGNPAYL